MAYSVNTQICLLGSTSAGKSCFIGGLGILADPSRDSDFQVKGRDTQSQEYLNVLVDALRSRFWPPPTTVTRVLDLEVRYQEVVVPLSLLDFSGEEFKRAARNLDYTRLPQLWERLETAQFVLLMLDPAVDLAGDELLGDDKNKQRERLDALLNAVFEVCHTQVQEGKRASIPDVAVLLSKCDEHPELRNGTSPRDFLAQRAPGLWRRIREWNPRAAVFAVSAVGELEFDPRDSARRPPNEPCPQGYEQVFEWVLARKNAPVMRRRLNWALGCLAFVVLVWTAWFAQLAWHKAHLTEQATPAELAQADRRVIWPTAEYRVLLNSRIEAAIRHLQSRLAQSPGKSELKEMETAAGALATCRNSQHQEETKHLFGEIQQVRRRLLFDAVAVAFRWQSPNFPACVEEFLRDFPQGDDATQVRDMQKQKREELRKRERRQVREIAATEYGFLQKKATAIASYLSKFNDEEQSVMSQMQQAEKLARTLANQSLYTVRLRSCGTFAVSRDHAVQVLHKGESIAWYDHDVDASSSNWGRDDACFSINWRFGDTIEVKLWSLDWSNNVAASVSRNGLSLEALCGETSLHPWSNWSRSDFSQGPHVRFELDGFTDDDWTVLHDWVYPGAKW